MTDSDRPRRSNSSGLHKIGKRTPSLLSQVLGGARKYAAAAGNVAVDGETWQRLMGPRIAQRARPGAVHNGVLTVRVASAVWAQELSLLSDDILQRLRKAGLELRALRFQVTDIDGAKEERALAARSVEPLAIPPELAERLAGFDDPELRDAIARAAGLSLAVQARAERSAAVSAKPRAARGPQSAAPRSAHSDRSGAAPNAARRRTREDPEG